MNALEMSDQLGLRLEDPDENKFTKPYKLIALNNAQIGVANFLRNEYLTELEVLKTNVTVTSGMTAALTAATLGYNVLRGAQGIRWVRTYNTTTYHDLIDIMQAKKTENQFLAGTALKPRSFVFANKIIVQPSSIAAIDVYFLKMPDILYNSYDADSGTQTTIVSTDTDLSAVADYYNGGLIYNITAQRYYKINDYADAAGTKTFTVDDPGSGTCATVGDKFYVFKRDFETTNLDQVTCELNASLHPLVITLAEAECWAIDRDLERRAAAEAAAVDQIVDLNTNLQDIAGIGTKGDRRYLTGAR